MPNFEQGGIATTMTLGRTGKTVRVSIFALILAISLLGSLVSSAAAGALAPSSAVFANEQLYSNGNNWEPTVAADPGSNYVYMATTQIGGNCKSCAFWSILMRVSSDGGNTWGPATHVCGAGCAAGSGDWQADPAIKVASNGAVYVTYLNKFNPGATLQKSSDHGASWTAPVVVSSLTSNDKPWLAISPSGKDVYVAFNNASGGGGQSMVAASHDYGASFSRPIQTSSDKLSWFAWSGVVAPNGSVYFAEDAENTKTFAANLVLVSSTDGGLTWQSRVMATSQAPPLCTATNCPPDQYSQSSAIAVDASGTLLYTYTANSVAGAPKSLYVTRSSDGATWSAPTLVNASGDSTFPVIAPGPTAGDFRLAWQDNRNGGVDAWNTYFSRSTNSGGSWSAQTRLSNLGTGAAYKAPSGYQFPYGDYMGLAVNPGGGNIAVWGEGQGWQTTGGSWFATGS